MVHRMVHIVLHVAVPILVALVFYRPRWVLVSVILVATMLVDLDHLLADPIYDPNRCSIGFHPLHTPPVIAGYVLLALAPAIWRKRPLDESLPKVVAMLHLAGVGLLIHMALDWGDCLS